MEELISPGSFCLSVSVVIHGCCENGCCEFFPNVLKVRIKSQRNENGQYIYKVTILVILRSHCRS